MKRHARPVSIALFLLLACPTMAADIELLKVKRKKGRIDIRSEIFIDAPTLEVYDALLEYDKFAQLSNSFTESRYIEPAPDGAPRIYTKVEGCIWFFCKTIERYARLELEPKWKITAITEPEHSDADESIETWTLTAKEDRTFLEYHHDLKPGFWVPPLIGVFVIRGTIKRSVREAANRIEKLAIDSLAETAE